MEELTRMQAIERLGSWIIHVLDMHDGSIEDEFGNTIRTKADGCIEVGGALVQRYWIETECLSLGKTDTYILPAGISKEKAIEEARKEWDHLTTGEQRKTTVRLCYGLVDVAQDITDPFGKGHDTIEWEKEDGGEE